MIWDAQIDGLSAANLASLPRLTLAKGAVLFRPGEEAQGFVILLNGRIEVHLTGPSGREILLYAIDPGQSCIQSTLGLIGDEPYSGEAVTASDVTLIIIPKALFNRLMDTDAAFRRFVLNSFARRMKDVTSLLERVAFGRIEGRLAAALLGMAVDGEVHATQAEIAARIGSVREVVTRRLDAFARSGWVETDQGTVRITDMPALRRCAASDL